jgi:hypothetical protein
MAGNPIGLVTALLSTDKLPGTYLQTRFGVGGNPANQIRNILVVAAPAIGGGTLTPDTEVLDIVADGDEVTYYGNEGCEGARMVRMMRKVPGIGKIKAATATISGGAAASATITIDGTWSTASTGPRWGRGAGSEIKKHQGSSNPHPRNVSRGENESKPVEPYGDIPCLSWMRIAKGLVN